MDLLFDARRTLKLVSPDLASDGLLGLLRKVDGSFAPVGRGSFRAANDAGYMVDLIKPMPKDRFSTAGCTSLGGPDDVQAVEIEGLRWLINSPKHRTVVFDERGYPFEMSVPDARAFALHEAWLSSRDDREPIRRKRDEGQARLVAALVAERLPRLAFDAPDLTALPAALRRSAELVLRDGSRKENTAASRVTPDW